MMDTVRKALGILVVSLLLVPTRSQASGLPVVDVDAGIKLFLQYKQQLVQYVEMVKQTANQVQQVQNQAQQIVAAYEQVKQGVQNLQHFDLNNATNLLGLISQFDSKLNQAQMLGYQAQHVVRQAQSLYTRLEGVVDGRTLAAMQQRWAGVQREGALVALQVQSVQVQHQQRMAQIADLMNRAAATRGNLDAQQALAQGQGLIATQLVTIEQQLATQGRLQAMTAMQQATLDEATAHALAEASGTIDLGGPPRGRILSLSK
jgi:P-type conjugative transfer protein TrbJ